MSSDRRDSDDREDSPVPVELVDLVSRDTGLALRSSEAVHIQNTNAAEYRSSIRAVSSCDPSSIE